MISRGSTLPFLSVLLLPPFQGASAATQFTYQCQLHTFVELPPAVLVAARLLGNFTNSSSHLSVAARSSLLLPAPPTTGQSLWCVNRPSQGLDITSPLHLTWTSLHPTPHWAHRQSTPRADKFNLLSVS